MKVPVRCCAACRRRSEKAELFRLVSDVQGNVTIDLKQKSNGRGVYLCRKRECIDTAKKRHSLDRALKSQVSDGIYDRLKELTDEQT